MFRTRTDRTTSILAALTAIAALALPASAGEQRPFYGRGTEAVIAAAPTSEGLAVTATGAGQATHLGRFTRVADVVIHPDNTFDGTVVFTAANGDRLVADLAGGFTSQTTLAGVYTFTGGSGRFSDASGTAGFEGETPDGIHVSLTFKGSIQY
jgi:hypothetical protein